jgi:hypothetical protein
MKKYAVGILEDEQHKFYDTSGREIIFWMVDKMPFDSMPLKFRIQEVLWDSEKEVRILMIDDSNIYAKHQIEFGLSNQEVEQLPQTYTYVFARIVKVGRSIQLEVFTSEHAQIETARADDFIEESAHYFEIGIDEIFKEFEIYNGVIDTGYFKSSFMHEGNGKGLNMLLSTYDIDDSEYYSYVLNAQGFMMDFDLDFEDAKWSEQCKTFRNMYKVDLEEVNWTIKGKPEIRDNGQQVWMTLVNCEGIDLELDVEKNKSEYLAGKKWRIVDMRTVFSA